MTLALAAGSVNAEEPVVTFTAAPDGVPLCVAEGGNPQGPPLVLIHGYSQSHAVFARQFDSELAQTYRLIAPDLRGHGCSGKPWEESAYAGARPWADDIAAVLSARRVARPVLMGWSAGGYWIVDYIREHGTQDLAGVVFTGSHGGLMSSRINPAIPALSRQMRDVNLAYPPDLAHALQWAEQFLPRMSASPLPEDIRRIMYADTFMLPAYARRAMATRSMDNADLTSRMNLPLLLIYGEQDRTATPEQLQALLAELPQAELLTYAQTGHSTFAEQPDRFNQDLARFAQRVRAGQPPR